MELSYSLSLLRRFFGPLAASVFLVACDGQTLPVASSSSSQENSSKTSSSKAISSEALSSEISSSQNTSSQSMFSSEASSAELSSQSSTGTSSSQPSSEFSSSSEMIVSSSEVAVSSSEVMVSSEQSSSEESSSSEMASSSSSSVALGCEVSDTRFDLNDVSILFPLPTSDDELDSLLDFDDAGVGGQLASQEQQDGMLEVLLSADARAGIPQMRIVGVRFDPCANGREGSECTKELRLVVQPVGKPGDTYKAPLRPEDDPVGRLILTATDYFGHDQVLHFIYELTDDNFALLTEDLKQLKTLAQRETSCVPLNVHPVMARQGLDGEYATTLKAIVQRYAGEANLERAAFTAARGGSFWFFALMTRERGFTFTDAIVKANTFSLITGTTHETHKVDQFGPDDDSTLWALAYPNGLSDPVGPFPVPNQLDFNKAINESLQIDNPKLVNPENNDCVACHSAQRLRENRIDDRRFVLDESVWDDLYENPRYDMSAPVNDRHGIGSLRMFGYMNEDAHISIRVINDSAESADQLNAVQ